MKAAAMHLILWVGDASSKNVFQHCLLCLLDFAVPTFYNCIFQNWVAPSSTGSTRYQESSLTAWYCNALF